MIVWTTPKASPLKRDDGQENPYDVLRDNGRVKIGLTLEPKLRYIRLASHQCLDSEHVRHHNQASYLDRKFSGRFAPEADCPVAELSHFEISLHRGVLPLLATTYLSASLTGPPTLSLGLPSQKVKWGF